MKPGLIALAFLLALAVLAGPAAAASDGTLTWGLHVTLATKWVDPSDTEAFINPFMVLYAIHDALVKPVPAGDNTPRLAESWTVSKTGSPTGTWSRRAMRVSPPGATGTSPCRP